MKIEGLGDIFADKLSRTGRYPVADRPPGYWETGFAPGGELCAANLAAKWTGERRPPRKGEYYISGAAPMAYRAPNDLGNAHAIARIIRVAARVVIDESPFEMDPKKRS